jgi:hypothetical protein
MVHLSHHPKIQGFVFMFYASYWIKGTKANFIVMDNSSVKFNRSWKIIPVTCKLIRLIHCKKRTGTKNKEQRAKNKDLVPIRGRPAHRAIFTR